MKIQIEDCNHTNIIKNKKTYLTGETGKDYVSFCFSYFCIKNLRKKIKSI